jgi:GNAT-family acetyltransferase (TIGR03103 family)
MNVISDTDGIILQCGWGRLLFGDTFTSPEALANAIQDERADQRDIAMYLVDPHLVINCAPQRIFLDPSNTYRLELDDCPQADHPPTGFTIGALRSRAELDEVNRIYSALNMVPVDADYVWHNRDHTAFHYAVARADSSGQILGVAMGADHHACAPHLPQLCSVWAVAVDPQSSIPGIGEALMRHFIALYANRGRKHLDVSVVHDNDNALRLYQKLNFQRVYVFAAKRRNRINERLFVGEPDLSGYNPYAMIIIKEALRRGIAVDPIDPPRGYFKLALGGREIVCWESLSELTSAIAVMRTSDKALTRHLFKSSGLHVPDQLQLLPDGDNQLWQEFLSTHTSVVVKPLHGEQGKGISVDLSSPQEVAAAIELARRHCDVVLLESYETGDDLRVVVIQGEVVAAAIRRPPVIRGNGQHSITQLIEKLSRRRAAMTDGESRVPLDDETIRCVRRAGHAMEDVLDEGQLLAVRKTANLHTGGTLHDVTAQLHPDLAKAAIAAADALAIPVVGLDMLVPSPAEPDYVLIEANERPGLANHEPQPTAAKFIDLLFPHSICYTDRNE